MLHLVKYLTEKRIPDTRRGRFVLEALVAVLCACVAILMIVIVVLRFNTAFFRQRSDAQALPERVVLNGGASFIRISSPLPLPVRIADIFPFLTQELTYEALVSAAQKDFLVRIPASGWDKTRIEQKVQGAFLRLSSVQTDLRLPDGTRVRAIDNNKISKTLYFGDFVTIGDKKNTILGGITGGYVYLSNSPALIAVFLLK